MWILFSVSGAFFQACEMAIKKKALQLHGMNNFIACLAFLLAGFLLTGLFFFKTGQIGVVIKSDLKFWNGIFWAVFPNLVAVYYLYKALDITDLSYLMPWLTLTSLSIIVPPLILLGEIPSLISFVGIFVVFIGALLMDYKPKTVSGNATDEGEKKNNSLAKLYLLIVALCWTITPTAMKIAIINSSALFVSYVVHLLIGLSFGLLIVATGEYRKIRDILGGLDSPTRKNFFIAVLLAGIFIAANNTSINMALASANVSYVMAIKRIMPIFAFGIGYLYFKERYEIKKKIVATLLMVMGAILITLFP